MIKRVFKDGKWTLTGDPSTIGTVSLSPEGISIYDAGSVNAITITSKGIISMHGNIIGVASAIFQALANEREPGLTMMVINDTIECYFREGISIKFIGDDKPKFFDELAETVKRFSELQAFS